MTFYVYLIKTFESEFNTHRYKIGMTNNIKKRKSQLDRQSPYPLVFLKTYKFNTKAEAVKIEKSLHNFFSKERIMRYGKPTEWFNFISETVAINKVDEWLQILYKANIIY